MKIIIIIIVNEVSLSFIKFIPHGKKRRTERARRSQVQRHHEDQERQQQQEQQQQGQKVHSEVGKSATTSRQLTYKPRNWQ